MKRVVRRDSTRLGRASGAGTSDGSLLGNLADRFGRPLAFGWCVVGWVVASLVFIGLVALFGGPSQVDALESMYSTWAVANGHVACAYPPGAPYHFANIGTPVGFIAPLWPVLSGGIAGLVGVGHGVPFPSQAALGSHCSTALAAMTHWSAESKAVNPTVRLGYLSWFALMAGVVALLRASGRGRCGWEPATLILLAATPFAAMPLLDDFHPQDLMAMGLALGGVACARRGRWVWAGLLLGLAVTAQQYALLVFAPLFIVAPPSRRIRFASGALVAGAFVVLPLTVITSGHALRAIVLGSGNTPSLGGTVVWELHLKGVPLVATSRILPIVFATALAYWAMRRLGRSVLEPVPLISLIATSLSFRLVFEQNLFGYYFMALAVLLIVLDAVNGRIRGQLVAWLSLVVLAFDPVPRIHLLSEYSPSVLMVIVCFSILWGIQHGRVHWYLVAWVGVVAVAFASYPIGNFRYPLPTWLWQVVLVGTGVTLAVKPLLSWKPDVLDQSPMNLALGASNSSLRSRDDSPSAEPDEIRTTGWISLPTHDLLHALPSKLLRRKSHEMSVNSDH